MIGERREDIIQVAVDSLIEKMITKYYKAHLGDRLQEGTNGEIYDEEGRQPAANSEAEQYQLRLADGGQPGR